MEDYSRYKQLPFTIIPITEGALRKNNANSSESSTPKPPDLTFHCMCCEEYFISPFLMYEHLNTKHADMPEPQDPEEELDDNRDYSWVFEPVCELVAPEEGEQHEQNGVDVTGECADSDSDDTDSDDDSSTSSSSSLSSSSSGTSSNSNSNTNTQDELTTDSLAADRRLLTMDDNTTMEVMEEAAYEEVEAVSLHSQGSQNNAIQLKVADPRESTSIILLNPPLGESNAVPPILAQPVRRGRGRRSAAQQAAIEMSSLISGEPKCFQCSHCEESFPSAGDLSKHVRCHITNKPFQCSICEKTFTHIGSLNTHIRIHSGEKPYKCELCSKAFTQSSSLMVHLRSHSIRKPHQCHLCDKGFVNSTSLVIHLKTHKYGSRYSCSECDKSFKHEAQLKEHMRMHNQTLVYQCSICRNAFASSSELVQHMKCHMGEKPFTCSICDRSFTQSGSLNIHMRIHTGEKPFNCKLCNKSFTQASSLSVHMKIHSGEKPFPCHICGKSYSQAAYLSKHIQQHVEAQKQGLEPACPTPNETLLCIVCGDLHRNATSLALHVTERHAALLHNMKENPFKNLNVSEEERLHQEQQYIQQIQLLMQMQQQMIREHQQNPQKMEDEELDEDREESEEENVTLQLPQDIENASSNPEDDVLARTELQSGYQQKNLDSEHEQIEEEHETEKKIQQMEEEISDGQTIINNENNCSSYDKESEFEEGEDEPNISNVNKFCANDALPFSLHNNNGFSVTTSEYPFLEDAEYDDYDDYAAEEEVETEE